jgi:DNA integrity scanning protein DisA with diadenylate cyclase activity
MNAKYFIEVFPVIFYRCFDVMNDVRINKIIELLVSFADTFIVDDRLLLHESFLFWFLEKFGNRFSIHLCMLFSPEVIDSHQDAAQIENEVKILF